MTPSRDEPLLGGWVSDPGDAESASVHGLTTIEFRGDGVVATTTHPEGRTEHREERYRIDGGELVIAAPGGGERRLSFRITPRDRLILGLGEGESVYQRRG